MKHSFFVNSCVLIGLLLSSLTAYAQKEVADTASSKRIFIGDRFSGQVDCFAVQEPSGNLKEISSCDTNYADIVGGARIADLEFYDNCLYAVDSSGGTMGVKKFNLSTDSFGEPLEISEPIMGWALYHFGKYFYIPGQMESVIATYEKTDKDSCSLKMIGKPLYIGDYALGATSLQPTDEVNQPNSFFQAGYDNNKVTIVKQMPDGEMQNTTITYPVDGNRPRFLQLRNGYLYVTNQQSSAVTIFHVGKSGALTAIPKGHTVFLKAFNPSRFAIVGEHAYALGQSSGSIEVFDILPDGGLVSKQNVILPKGAMPFAFHIDDESHTMYITTVLSGFIVSVKILVNGQLDASTFQIVKLYNAPAPWWMTANY